MNLQSLVTTQHQHAQTGGLFIGSLIWWSLNGNRVAHARLKELADQHGLPERYLPAEVRPASAFRRAWRHGATKLPQGLLLRQIDDTPTGIHIGLVEEQADAQTQELRYAHLLTVAFNKEHHTIQASEDRSVVEEIRTLYAHHLELTTRDIRTMLSNFVNEAGVSLRESGGVYFIAAPHQDTIDAMASVLQAIGHNQLHQLPLYDSPLTQDVLNGVAVTTLDDEIQRLQDELEAFFADDKTRKSTLEKRLNTFDALRARVDTFAGVLSFKSDALLGRVSDMEADLRQRLGMEDTSTPLPSSASIPDTTFHLPPTVPDVPAFPSPSLETALRQDESWGVDDERTAALCFDPEAGF